MRVDVRTLLEAPSPAVIAVHRGDGSIPCHRFGSTRGEGSAEVVIAEGDAKLQHLRADPRVG